MEATLRPATDQAAATDEGNIWNWEIHDGEGKLLSRIGIQGPPPLGVATATLCGDHGYPKGQWAADDEGFHFVAEDPQEDA